MKWYHKVLFVLFPPLMLPYIKAKCQALVQDADKKVYELQKGNFRIQPQHETEFCFEAGGKKYFKFINEFTIPSTRAMSALDVYTEVEQKVDKPYLDLAFATIRDLCNKGDLVGVAAVVLNAQKRLDHICNVDMVYKLASVLYFDEEENPYDYDTEYAEKKIALWRKENVKSFFLRTPLSDYLPSFGISSVSIANYTHLQRVELVSHLKKHLSQLSASDNNKDLIASTLLQVETLEQLIHSDAALY